ncbi:MAG: ATP-binding protein [Muribaculaceae bacterium]|nr:ATP-binding protein [Muribaculaceae bacterium]
MSHISRIIEKEITTRIRPGKVMLLYGARRVGKTVLLRDLVKKHSKRPLILNGESAETYELLRNRSIANYRQLLNNVDVLAIDEAQHVPDIGMILKLIVDEVEGIRVIASGSSSLDLQNKAGEPLVGRSSQFMLTPLSIEEISKTEPGIVTMAKAEERMIYGLYPELVGIENPREKKEYLEDIVDSYLLRDILMLDGLKNSSKLHDLLRMLAWQVGSEVSLDELSRTLGLSRNTVDRYIDLLQKVFVIYKVGGYARNLRKEISKSSKWYFQDTGIRNAVLRDFRPLSMRPDTEKGALWENFIISERMKRNLNHKLGIRSYFWRTYDHQEIDLIEETDQGIAAFEIKAGKAMPKAPKAFANAYSDASFNVINKDNYLPFLLNQA